MKQTQENHFYLNLPQFAQSVFIAPLLKCFFVKGHKFFTVLQCTNGLPPILSIVKSKVNLHQECALFLFCLSMEDINQGFLGNNVLVHELKL